MSENNFTSPIAAIDAASLIHQLTNTLRSINALTASHREQLSAEKGLSRETGDILAEVEKLTRGSLRQLGDYLDQARRHFSEDAKISPVNVNLTIQESLQVFSHLSDSDSVSFKITLTPELPDVRAVKPALVLAVINLIQNAVDAVRQKGGKPGLIEIKSHEIEDKVAIDVIDNGVGIPTELKKDIFEIGSSTKSHGRGMGLWLTKQTIRQWGGEVEIVGTGPGGTVFRILLNRWEPAISLAGERRMLIVEDEAAQRHALTHSLSVRGFEVYSAGTIAEAVSHIRASAYDIALLDMRLEDPESPAMTGLDLARMVREYNPDALIIIFSAYTNLEFMREAFRIGIDDYIDKVSFSFEELMRRIEVTLPRKLEEAAQRRETRQESIRRGRQDRFIYETLSIFSHELRSPLMTVHWNIEALRSGALGEMSKEQTEALENIRSAIKREVILLDTHLDLSRIERGMEALSYQPYDLVKIIKEEVLAHAEAAKRKNIRINSLLPEETAIVRIDINRLRAALNPLMDNAVKFSSEGGEISISVKLETGYVEVYISDQGPGIKPEELDRLLGRSSSKNVTLDQRVRASGLGLSLAKRIIEDYHDGKLWFVKNKKGEKGTTVAFRLPVQ
jgi:signal transduction histidine kinase